MKIADFFVQLGVKADTYTVREFGSSIANLPLATAGAIASLAGMQLGMIAMTGHMLDLSNTLGIFRSETGLSAEELQRWQNAAKQMGVSADSVKSSVMGIADAQARLRFGDAGVAVAAGRLGIGEGFIGKDPFAVLKQLREVYKTMDPNQFRMFASGIGVSPEMTRLFGLSQPDFSRAMATGPTLGQGDMKVLTEFQGELSRFATTIEQSFVPVLREVGPQMGDLARNIGDLVKALAPIVGNTARGTSLSLGYMNSLLSNPKGTLSETTETLGMVVDYLLQKNGIAMEKLTERLEKSAAEMKGITVNQHIHGVQNAEDVDRVGAEHLKSELRRSSKTVNRGY